MSQARERRIAAIRASVDFMWRIINGGGHMIIKKQMNR